MTIDSEPQALIPTHPQVPAVNETDRASQMIQESLLLLQREALENVLSPSIIPPISITATQRISHSQVQPKLTCKISKVDALTQFRNSLEESDRHLNKKPSPVIRQKVILQGRVQNTTPSLQI